MTQLGVESAYPVRLVCGMCLKFVLYSFPIVARIPTMPVTLCNSGYYLYTTLSLFSIKDKNFCETLINVTLENGFYVFCIIDTRNSKLPIIYVFDGKHGGIFISAKECVQVFCPLRRCQLAGAAVLESAGACFCCAQSICMTQPVSWCCGNSGGGTQQHWQSFSKSRLTIAKVV